MADPAKIEEIYTLLMNFSNLNETFTLINESLIADGIALPLLLKELNNILLVYDIPDEIKVINLYDERSS